MGEVPHLNSERHPTVIQVRATNGQSQDPEENKRIANRHTLSRLAPVSLGLTRSWSGRSREYVGDGKCSGSRDDASLVSRGSGDGNPSKGESARIAGSDESCNDKESSGDTGGCGERVRLH